MKIKKIAKKVHLFELNNTKLLQISIFFSDFRALWTKEHRNCVILMHNSPASLMDPLWLNERLIGLFQNFEKSSKITKIWQKMKTILIQK